MEGQFWEKFFLKLSIIFFFNEKPGINRAKMRRIYLLEYIVTDAYIRICMQKEYNSDFC